MKQPIAMIRGTTQVINITVTNSTGQPYVLASNEVIRFGVKRRPDEERYVISKELTSAHYKNGVYVLILNPSDTNGLKFGTYSYDVGLQSGTSYFNIIECSNFDIRYNVTGVDSNA